MYGVQYYDVDFLMRGLNNDLTRMDEIITEILAVDTGNDFAAFKAGKTEPIAVQRKYHKYLQNPACDFSRGMIL